MGTVPGRNADDIVALGTSQFRYRHISALSPSYPFWGGIQPFPSAQ
jgi:hypothetical protein